MDGDMHHPSERHYRYHLLRMALGLAFSLALGVGMIVGLMRPGVQTAVVVAPAVVFIAAMVVLDVMLRGRRWPRSDPEETRIGRDEWVQTNIGRARKVALLAVYAAQVPLMFIVAYLPSDPTIGSSVVGMAILTMVSAGTGFFGSYLVFSRLPSDG